jgi:2-keto-4-pentenoate hydratase/2-oxohepta-3-ene-1,7-dioic acid hydratase in catechol pathway
MKIGRFYAGSSAFTGIVKNGTVYSVGNDPLEFIFRDSVDCSHLQSLTEKISMQTELCDVVYLPLLRPGKIICLGLNYRSHAIEGNWQIPGEPVYFEKSSSTVIAHKTPIKIPKDIGRVDPEVELAVIIGKQCRKISPENAGRYIAGYTILNDVTARTIQKKDQEMKYPWFRSKSMDTFCPVGPWLVTADEIGPRADLKITLRVNGKIRQDSSTGRMIFQVPEILAQITRYLTLEPGDIISTGTPEGIGPILPGDTVECEIEGIGVLTNPVISDDN